MKIVLTGAAGALGQTLRPMLAEMGTLVSTDIAAGVGDLRPGEAYRRADLGVMAEVAPLMEGADVVVHFGAIADEAPWDDIHHSNILGAYNVWEAAHAAGVRRIVYASSVHAVGMHLTSDGIDLDVPHRPDTFYGLAKCFAEDLGRLYWEKQGMESVHLRIFSCTPEPGNVRALGTWLSYGDLKRLVAASIRCAAPGFAVVYGVSANTRAPVDNAKAAFLGYRPQDDAEAWAEALMAKESPASDDPQLRRLGGPFAIVPLGESGVEMIKRMGEG